MAKRNQKLAVSPEEATNGSAVRGVAASAARGATGGPAANKMARDQRSGRSDRARRYRLYRQETPAQGLGRVARGQLDSAIELLERREGDDPVESIHEARKSLKRLRALLRVSRNLIGDETYRRENTILRDVGRELSGARDAQVLVETLDGLISHFVDELGDEPFSRFRQALLAEADAASEAKQDEAAASGAAATLTTVRTRVAMWELPQDGGPESLARGSKRIYRRGRRALNAAEKHHDGEHMHELRKRAKDLWHTTQLLREVGPKPLKKMRRRAHRLSDLLGDDHDLLVLKERATCSPGLFRPDEHEVLDALIERRRGALQEDALACANRVYSRRPRSLRRLMRSLKS